MKAKTLAALAGLLTTLPAFGQDMAAPMPPELASANFMVGHWDGSMSMSTGPGVETKFKATIDCDKILGGRYIRQMHKYSVDGGMEMSGMLLLTYDSQAKTWTSWWYDSAAPGSMEMTGQLASGAFTFESKPTEMPGMGMVVTRSTFTKVSDTKVTLKLETKQDKDWTVFMSAEYTKK